MKEILKPLLEKTDEELVRLVEEGNNDAFEALMMHQKKEERKYLHKLLHNRALEKDAEQNIAVEVFRKLRTHHYKESGHFKEWFRTITYRQAALTLRSEKHFTEATNIADVENKIAGEEYDTTRDEQIEKLKQAVSKLNIRQRTVVKLRMEDDLSFPEIARKLNKPLGTVTKDFVRTLNRLRKFFDRKK